MYKSFYCLWIFLLTIQEFFPYGQTQFTDDDSLDPLSMDQAYLTISNKNYSDTIIFTYNLVVCEKCDFGNLGDPVLENSNQTIIINTTYAHDFNITSSTTNKTLCRVESYKFSEHGSYFFEVIQINENVISCEINQTKESGYYWLPVIIGMGTIFIFILFIQLWHCISHSPYCSRYLPNSIRQGLMNNDFSITIPTNLSTNVNDSGDDILGTLRAGSELPLRGSTGLTNNSIRITKVLPKRLRSLDIFRGFSLMVMIFVNYGGNIFRIFSFLLMSIFFLRWWLLVF